MKKPDFKLTAIVLVVILTLAFKFLGETPLRVEPQAPPEVVEYSKSLKAMDEAALAAQLRQPGKAVFFFYASWCPYCKKQFPEMVMFSNANSRVPVHFISVDENPYALSRYLIGEAPPDRLTMHILKEPQALGAILKRLGVDYRGGIPVTLFLDETGKPAQMLRGYQSLANLTQALDRVK